jgi:hypothetical protein
MFSPKIGKKSLQNFDHNIDARPLEIFSDPVFRRSAIALD